MNNAKWLDRKGAINWMSIQVFERCSTLTEAFNALQYLKGYTYTNQCKSVIDVPVFFDGYLATRQERQLFNDVCTELSYDSELCWNEYQASNTVSNDSEQQTAIIETVTTVEPTQVTEAINSDSVQTPVVAQPTIQTNREGYTMAYYNSYDPCNLSPKQWELDVNKHNTTYNSLKDMESITVDSLNSLIIDGFSFWIKVINDNPYFNNDCVLVELTLRYINKPITLYISKKWYNSIMKTELTHIDDNSTTSNEQHNSNDFTTQADSINNNTLNNLHWYEMLHRPLSPFCQPKGYIQYDSIKGKNGIIAYNRTLTADELDEYELREWAITG